MASRSISQPKTKLEALLLEGLNSGDPVEITPEYWEGKRLALVARHGKKTETR
jgi:hypothetical protein